MIPISIALFNLEEIICFVRFFRWELLMYFCLKLELKYEYEPFNTRITIASEASIIENIRTDFEQLFKELMKFFWKSFTSRLAFFRFKVYETVFLNFL